MLFGEWGVDVVVGNMQCFGVLMGFGGLYVVYMVVCDEFKCQMLGCFVGVMVDVQGKFVLCFVLQMCEQYICCEKVMLNVCIVQVLFVIMVSMYVVYYGLYGLKMIVLCVNCIVVLFVVGVKQFGFVIVNDMFFDMLMIDIGVCIVQVYEFVKVKCINLCCVSVM